MQVITKEIEAYDFAELSDSAKQAAMQWYCEGACDGFWSEFIIDDVKQIGQLIGFDIENIYYSGFSSQGDGACFTGSIKYRKGGASAVKAHAPRDTELHRIAREWQSLQKRNFYALRAQVAHRGHYQHEMCTVFDCEDTRHNYGCLQNPDIEDEIKEIARDFMRWIYRTLESEYEYQTSEETISEACTANGWLFTAAGRII